LSRFATPHGQAQQNFNKPLALAWFSRQKLLISRASYSVLLIFLIRHSQQD
jgi:hypothetical protein